jgi:hypothetical protein
MSPRKAAVSVPQGPPPRARGLLGSLKTIAAQASTFQKLAAATIAAISLAGVMATMVTRYAPWAWAADVERRQTAIEGKIDTLSSIVLQSQAADAEQKIAALEAKGRSRGGLTEVEAEYLRGQRRRLNDVNRQLQTLSRPSR